MVIFSEILKALVSIFSKKPKVSKIAIEELVAEALKWQGVTEKGPGVDVFRQAVDGKAGGEAWCAAFVMYCARSVSLRHGTEPTVHITELCYDMWHKSPERCRLQEPVPGCFIVWNYPGTTRGHVGIVSQVINRSLVRTIEGNTSDPESVKQARGVYSKIRSTVGEGHMKVLGFLNPFA